MECKVDKCDRDKFCKGYCRRHYGQMYKHGYILSDEPKRCMIVGCEKKYYGKGYCHNHHAYYLRPPITDEYRLWVDIKTRCYNKKSKSYQYYGGRGITMCDEWLHDFKVFHNYIGERPSKVHSLDRINGSKGYEPGNVRWANYHEQGANKRNNNDVVGVYLAKPHNLWLARLVINKVRVLHKYFPINRYDDAVKARKEAEIEYGIYGVNNV